ncbi:hypothetical protein EMPS_09006 [Entomortierella parvispora]|uniref:Uncharacterized protein n=1 Tax=Entomortierella parvispora TaxID=205924 RepID=A0A9P3HHE7_9FUNG|nr:hypothetical protein EMPS_09006 [Entomortierella parvispora]
MKFTPTVALATAVLALSVSAQTNSTEGGACQTCLQDSLMALPACTGLNITMGEVNPSITPQYAACLCSSINGTWIDACTKTCGSDIDGFKQAYAQEMEGQIGLNCNGTTPTFVPVPTGSVIPPIPEPSATGAAGSGSGAGGKGNAGAVSYLPWTTEVTGAIAVVAAVGASFL